MTFARAFDYAAQILIPTLTLSSVLAISLKHPALGLLLNLLAQPFWLYSTYIAWKRQGQIGMFINTKSDVLQFLTWEGAKISVRPSGTEPKIKFYISVNLRMSDPNNFTLACQHLDAKIQEIEKSMIR
jgi:phosphomannomutase